MSKKRSFYIQIDGVAMGSPLGPVLANIFIVELEKIIIPKLEKEVKLWRRFVDDTICFAEMDSLNCISLTTVFIRILLNLPWRLSKIQRFHS